MFLQLTLKAQNTELEVCLPFILTSLTCCGSTCYHSFQITVQATMLWMHILWDGVSVQEAGMLSAHGWLAVTQVMLWTFWARWFWRWVTQFLHILDICQDGSGREQLGFFFFLNQSTKQRVLGAVKDNDYAGENIQSCQGQTVSLCFR